MYPKVLFFSFKLLNPNSSNAAPKINSAIFKWRNAIPIEKIDRKSAIIFKLISPYEI